MVNASASVDLAMPAPVVWSFVERYDNWADLFPGYQRHRLTQDGASIWTVRGDLGVLSRIVEVEIRPGPRDAAGAITFAVNGITEEVAGTGTFAVQRLGDGRSRLTFAIELAGAGPLGPVVNALLARRLPALLEQFTPALARRLEASPVP